MLVKLRAACTHLSSTVSQLFEPPVQKNRSFHVSQPTFCFPWRRPCDYHAMCCMDGKTFQCLSNPWQHVPIYLQRFPSYSSRQCKKSQFSRTAAHILFPLETALRLSRNVLHGWKDISMLVKPLAARTHLSSTVSQLFEPQVQKIAIFTYRSPHFCFLWGRPWGNHAKCCMDGKRIRCLQIVSQHVHIYLQQFSSYSKRKFKKSPFSRTAAHIFISPGDAPVIITQYVAWMERQSNVCQTPRSICLQ